MIKFILFMFIFTNNLYAQESLFNNISNSQINYLFLIDKSDYSLKVLDLKNKKILKKMVIAFGKKDGDKLIEGDKKTPEGLYRINKTMNKKRLERYYGENNVQRYGNGALMLNYPNDFDIKKGKTGSGIWIHGIDDDEKISLKRISKGCVVV